MNFPANTLFLVTGAAGFIGSNLVEALLNLGYKVRGIDNFLTGKKENIEEFFDNKRFEFIYGDIIDYKFCLDICNGVDYVLHQAALGSVPRSIKEPILYVENNIVGTANMLEAASVCKVKRFVYASSSSVYGDSTKLPKKEGDEGNVLSPYALTKKVNEHYGRLYTSVYGLECIGLRYFNVFGKKQDPNSMYSAVIPKFINAMLNNEEIIINGTGEQSRDFTYIENVIEANLLACIAKDVAGEVFNIAYGGRETINNLLSKISDLLGMKVKPTYGIKRKGDIEHSNADISKAINLLGYRPKYDLESGLENTIDWYKGNL